VHVLRISVPAVSVRKTREADDEIANYWPSKSFTLWANVDRYYLELFLCGAVLANGISPANCIEFLLWPINRGLE
jgi:hypothetical protein